MSHRTRSRLAMAAITAGTSLMAVAPANAASYSPGTAAAHIKYNSATNSHSFNCSFGHWRSGAKVTTHCDLYFREFAMNGEWYEFLDTKHTGSFTPPPANHTTATWHRKRTIGEPQYCLKARALSVDGGKAHTFCFV